MTGSLLRILEKINNISPRARYKNTDVTFSLYKAKNKNNVRWNDPDLKKLTLICRETFSRYGKRALLDKYDAKAAIYLVCATYRLPGSDQVINEWLSVRLVPGDGEPLGAGELELYRHKDCYLDKIVRDRLFKGSGDFWSKIVSSSRMCGVNPYSLGKNSGTRVHSKKHRYLAECFALIQWQFLLDGDLFPYDYVTEIIPSKLADKALAVTNGKDMLKPGSQSAYRAVGLNKSDILPDRNIYSYKFPMYWLNEVQLFSLLQQLIKKGLLSEKTFRYYLQTELTFDEIVSINSRPELSRLGNLLSVKGKIRWSEMTGSELRKLIDFHVKDEPELKITEIHPWINAIFDIVRSLKVDLM